MTSNDCLPYEKSLKILAEGKLRVA